MNSILIFGFPNIQLVGVGIEQSQSFPDIFQTDAMGEVFCICHGLKIVFANKVQPSIFRKLNINVNQNIFRLALLAVFKGIFNKHN